MGSEMCIRDSVSTDLVPGQGSPRQESCSPRQFLLNKAASQARMVVSPIKQLPTRLLQLLQHGVKVNFIDKSTFQPPPRPPRFIDPSDTLFAIQALQKGRKIGGGQQYLSRSRVSTPLHGKKRLVHALCPLNNATVKQPTRYETLKSLPNILKPNDFVVSLDVENSSPYNQAAIGAVPIQDYIQLHQHQQNHTFATSTTKLSSGPTLHYH